MRQFTLESKRLLLDAPTADDIADITRYCQDPVFERFLTIPWPYHLSDAQYFVTEFVPSGWADGSEFSWAIRSATGEPLLGVIGLRLPAAEVGFWLGAEYRGHGYMPEALASVADWVLDAAGGGVTSLGLEFINWECIAGNAASASVARKCGFTFTGVGPSRLPSRGGTHLQSWHGVLHANDSRDPKPGWPR